MSDFPRPAEGGSNNEQRTPRLCSTLPGTHWHPQPTSQYYIPLPLALHDKDKEESSVMAVQTLWWMSTKKPLYLRIPLQSDNPYTRLRFEHQRVFLEVTCPDQCTFLVSSPNVLSSSSASSRSSYSSQSYEKAESRHRLPITDQDYDERATGLAFQEKHEPRFLTAKFVAVDREASRITEHKFRG